MNSAGFRPPPAPIVPAPIVTSEFEEYGQQFTFPTQPINAPISVYTTKRTWSSIDVYMSLPPGSTFQGPFLSELNPSLGVLIYATSRGVRSLVASGRIGLEDEASRGVGPKHVATARYYGGAIFDVQLMPRNQLVPGASLQVGLLASNAGNDEDPTIGSISMSRAGFVPGSGLETTVNTLIAEQEGSAFGDRYQLMALHGINTNAAARYLQVIDVNASGDPVAGVIPMFSFPLSPIGTPGSEIYIDQPMLRAWRFRRGLGVVVSSTPALVTLAAAGDIAFQAWYR